MSQIRVVLNDAPIHCLDVLDSRGDRLIRIRPDKRGALFEVSNKIHCASLTVDDLYDLSAALSRIADQPASTKGETDG